ncbi:MAG: gliding motility-associated C-terminal domain-containing protein, partial [Bacteroidales bacterium]|nr:gliding motility-associated C-terminal domain-containing protein [Bacteroidales bacterium]
IIVNDINGCYADTTITLTEPDPIVTYFDITHISCHELGSISLSVEGGTPPYSNILWSTGATTDYIDNLDIGTYYVSPIDANGCIHIDSARVEYPPAVEYTLVSSNYNGLNTSCYGVADGWINITPLSGKAPYTISLSNDDTGEIITTSVATMNSTANFSNIKAGTYTLTLTDDNQCSTIETITITGPGLFELIPEPSVANNPNYNIPCYGEATGSILIRAENAVGNVEYLWSDGDTSSNRNGLTAGYYSVVAIDRNNCMAQTAVTLVQPQQLAVAFTITNAWCPDKPDGSIATDILGGVPSYSFEWSNGATELSLTNLVPDTYSLTVTDGNGCQINKEVTIEYEHRTCLDLPNAISPNGDLINDEWHITYNNLYPNMVVKILNRWGNVIWQSEKGYPVPWDGKDSRGTDLPMDSYHYIIDFGDGRSPQVGSITIVRD